MQTREAQYDPPKPENQDQDRRQARGDETTGQCARMKAVTPHACRAVRVAIAVALLSLPAAAPAAAQTTGSIEGAIVDANGSPLPGVVVTVTGPGVRQEHVTGMDGAYTAGGLAAGDYVVTAVLPGLETAEAPVSVQAGATASVSITLQIARLLETVSVVAEEPRIFASNIVAEPMMLQQSNITSVTSVVDPSGEDALLIGSAFSNRYVHWMGGSKHGE